MGIFGNWFYLTTLAIIAANRILSLLEVTIPYWSWYIDDFVSVVFILGVASWVLQKLKKEGRLPFSYLLSFFIMYSCYFEYYLPYYRNHGTSDLLDVLAYGLGIVCYHLFINSSQSSYPASSDAK